MTVSDVQRNLARLRPQVELAHWNPDGIKTGLCAAPPPAENALCPLAHQGGLASLDRIWRLGGRAPPRQPGGSCVAAAAQLA